MQRLPALPKPYLIVLAVASLAAAMVVRSIANGLLAQGIDPGLADKDFANYWVASRLLLSGQVQDLFGPWQGYFRHLRETFGNGYPWHNWSYPPHFLLLIWPLGLLGYKAALVAFLTATGIAFVCAYKAFMGERSLVAWVAVAPFMVLNLWAVQNGYLCAALALGALALRDKRPVMAGVLLGLLTIKPQLGLLFPFLLIAERRWTVIASAVVSAALLVAASAAILGVEAWRGYIQEVLPYQTSVMLNLRGIALVMTPSIYAALRIWGVGPDVALNAHLMVAVPMALILIVAFFRLHDGKDRAALLLTGTFIVTPYALSYDLGLFAAGVGLLASRTGLPPKSRLRTAALCTGMLLPFLMIPFAIMSVPIAPVVIFGIVLVVLREAGLTQAVLDRATSRPGAMGRQAAE